MKIVDNFNQEIYDSKFGIHSTNGTLVFTYKVPKDAKGGEYGIKVTSLKFPTALRKFRVNQNSQPEMFVTVDFERNNYSPGD